MFIAFCSIKIKKKAAELSLFLQHGYVMVKEIRNIVVIGTGNVSYHLVKTFISNDLRILQVVARSEKAVKKFSQYFKVPVITSAPTLLAEADLYVLAVNDENIEEAAQALNLNGHLVVHTSGTVSMDILQPISSNHGVVYPLQTLSCGRDINFRQVPVCIEASSNENLNLLDNLARKISDNVYQVDSLKRKSLHLAAVFASNFSYHMYTVAARILESENIDPEILEPLILETARKAFQSGPGTAQTGPAARNDRAVIQQHLELLRDHKLYSEIYQLISESIISQKKEPENEL
jgi:predicted short-subunit dehydrogenase-like oxidoreductase (DUF2520 family)